VWRRNLKEKDPDKYDAYLLKQKERNRERRKTIKKMKKKAFATDREKIVIEREEDLASARMKKFRTRKKIEKLNIKLFPVNGTGTGTDMCFYQDVYNVHF
jgi:RNA 3'-terminal phosphate cyclase